MVVTPEVLTRLSSSRTTRIGLQECMDASLVRTSSAEPLNAMLIWAKPDSACRRETRLVYGYQGVIAVKTRWAQALVHRIKGCVSTQFT